MKTDDVITFVAEKINWPQSKVFDILKYGSLPKQVKKAIKTPEDFKNVVSRTILSQPIFFKMTQPRHCVTCKTLNVICAYGMCRKCYRKTQGLKLGLESIESHQNGGCGTEIILSIDINQATGRTEERWIDNLRKFLSRVKYKLTEPRPCH